MLKLNKPLHYLEINGFCIFRSQVEVLLCGIDSCKCPSNIETIGAPERSLNIDWTDSKLNPYAVVQTRMVCVPQEKGSLIFWPHLFWQMGITIQGVTDYMQHKQENQVSSPSEEGGGSVSTKEMKIFLLSLSNEVQYCEIMYSYSFLVGVQYRLYLSDQLVCRLYMFKFMDWNRSILVNTLSFWTNVCIM